MAASQPPFLPYGRQTIDDEDIASVVQVLRGEWLTTGPTVTAFEEAFAQAVGSKHAVACANGTAGLHLAALALDLGPGDAVVVPTITFLATANAARYVGAEVVFADVDPDTGLMGPAELTAALQRPTTGRLRAIFPVHLAGQCHDMEEISRIARQHGLEIVEDACHALGASYSDRAGTKTPVGACGHSKMTVFSLHPVKTITMGEGGVVTTPDAVTAERLRRLRNHGMIREPSGFENTSLGFDRDTPNPWYYEMHEPGFNYRATDMQCALGTSQLRKLARFVEQRDRLIARYREKLGSLSPHVQLLRTRADVSPAWHLAVALIDFAALGRSRAVVMRALAEQRIGSQVHYVPVHRQPYYQHLTPRLSLPGADAYYARCLSLPLFPTMEIADVDRVVAALAASCGLQGSRAAP